MNDEFPKWRPSRRTVLSVGAASVASVAAAKFLPALPSRTADVFIARGQSYDGGLVKTIEDGLAACGFDGKRYRGKRILLKPNLVEPSREIPHMTTHPSMVVAAAEVFRRWGATVTVGEAPGHVRDTEMALVESGVGEALRDGGLDFADLNYEAAKAKRNKGGLSPLREIYFPQSVLTADLVVSMPKMKTHHWVGLTCAMKNFYGVLPGIKYGWPKNVLHHNGIPQTVIDINCTLPDTLAIVDGIDCMEGDGPIMGSVKHMGLVLVGQSLPSVDATAARIMQLDPQAVSYLRIAPNRLGPTEESMIRQQGERIETVSSRFAILDEPHLRQLRPVGSEFT
ncbi:DUF362 domain-containing protein [Adhaeretor mobilis]|uniref:DUF362 domain-containing protein n=1 Tax=Adhaeretor mobilis TaxID=1930276 RepID=A0A517MVZ9_9BACT|nr:DUF362 domain-containing protein [Adhaeretor mobilis]QDS98967.1 hypothetical protein HG15A2_22560 [Adhaeretor mobilis]